MYVICVCMYIHIYMTAYINTYTPICIYIEIHVCLLIFVPKCIHDVVNMALRRATHHIFAIYFMQFSSTFKSFNRTIEEHLIIDLSHNPQEVYFSVIVTVLFKNISISC